MAVLDQRSWAYYFKYLIWISTLDKCVLPIKLSCLFETEQLPEVMQKLVYGVSLFDILLIPIE